LIVIAFDIIGVRSATRLFVGDESAAGRLYSRDEDKGTKITGRLNIVRPKRSRFARRATGRAEMVTHSFRLRPIMKQGTAAGLPETWTHYPSVEEARAGAQLMYRNDRVLRVMIVTDSVGSFVEWIER
jgi:hypothetical protein